MPSEKQVEERKQNINSILTHLRNNGAKSRREISNELGLSWGCVSELTAILIKKNIVLEREVEDVAVKGRRPSIIALNPDICFLGIDVNIRGFSACVCNLSGKKISTLSGKINCDSKPELIQSIIDFVNLATCENHNICGIGFAMQGIFNKKTNAWNFPLNNISVDFSLDFQDVFKVPIVVEHDPDCILYGCFDKNEGNRMIVRLDSGIGVSVFKNGSFLKDELLEIGYFVINEEGDRLHRIISQSAFEKARKTQEYEAYLKYAGKHLGMVLGNICNFSKLDEIYFCGDCVSKHNLLNDSFYELYHKTVIPAYSAKIISVEASDAAYGAAKMAMEKFQY